MPKVDFVRKLKSVLKEFCGKHNFSIPFELDDLFLIKQAAVLDRFTYILGKKCNFVEQFTACAETENNAHQI